MQPEQQQRIMGYFIEEAKEHLNTIEQGLLNLQSTIEDPEMINEMFRAAHSVKGGAAMLGLNSIQQVSHRLEDFFKVLKDSPIRVNQRIESLFLQVFDALQELLGQLQGPFGLTDEAASTTVSAIEPTFTALEQQLAELAEEAGTIAQAASETDRATADLSQATTSSSVQHDSALVLIFQRDVPAQLRQMLQLFKQPDATAANRQQLQEICRNLISIGEQFDLSSWCGLIEAAKQAIADTSNPYRTLAPVVIKDIKQAQEQVLAGQAANISPCEQLQRMVPVAAVEPDRQREDLSDLLAVTSASNDIAQSEPSLPTASEFLAEEFEPAVSAQGEIEASFEDSFRDTFAVAGHSEPQGPEVGMAELNTLADLFEGEVPDLSATWQEEEIIQDAVDRRSGEQDGIFAETTSDFSDLLFDSSDTRQGPQDTSPDDLSDLFGDALLEGSAVAGSTEIGSTEAIEPLNLNEAEASDLNEFFAIEASTMESSASQSADDLFNELEDFTSAEATHSESVPASDLELDPFSLEDSGSIEEPGMEVSAPDPSLADVFDFDTSEPASLNLEDSEWSIDAASLPSDQPAQTVIQATVADPWEEDSASTASLEQSSTAEPQPELPLNPFAAASSPTESDFSDLFADDSSGETIEELTDQGDADFSSLFGTGSASSSAVEGSPDGSIEELTDDADSFDLNAEDWFATPAPEDTSDAAIEELQDLDRAIDAETPSLEPDLSTSASNPFSGSEIPDPWEDIGQVRGLSIGAINLGDGSDTLELTDSAADDLFAGLDEATSPVEHSTQTESDASLDGLDDLDLALFPEEEIAGEVSDADADWMQPAAATESAEASGEDAISFEDLDLGEPVAAAEDASTTEEFNLDFDALDLSSSTSASTDAGTDSTPDAAEEFTLDFDDLDASSPTSATDFTLGSSSDTAEELSLDFDGLDLNHAASDAPDTPVEELDLEMDELTLSANSEDSLDWQDIAQNLDLEADRQDDAVATNGEALFDSLDSSLEADSTSSEAGLFDLLDQPLDFTSEAGSTSQEPELKSDLFDQPLDFTQVFGDSLEEEQPLFGSTDMTLGESIAPEESIAESPITLDELDELDGLDLFADPSTSEAGELASELGAEPSTESDGDAALENAGFDDLFGEPSASDASTALSDDLLGIGTPEPPLHPAVESSDLEELSGLELLGDTEDTEPLTIDEISFDSDATSGTIVDREERSGEGESIFEDDFLGLGSLEETSSQSETPAAEGFKLDNDLFGDAALETGQESADAAEPSPEAGFGFGDDLFSLNDLDAGAAEPSTSFNASFDALSLDDMFGADQEETSTSEPIAAADSLDVNSLDFGEEEELGESFDLSEFAALGDELDVTTASPVEDDLGLGEAEASHLSEPASEPEAGDRFTELDALLGAAATSEADTSDEFDGLLHEDLASEELAAHDDFLALDDLLSENSVGSGSDATLDDLLGDDEPAVGHSSANDNFAELDDLLGDTPSLAYSGASEAPESELADFRSSQEPEADVEDFTDLEALLEGGPTELASPIAQLGEVSPDSEFDELDDLLKDAEEKMGGSPTVKVSRGLPPQRRITRPGRIFSEQTMRVPVKHLDNLSNLVGELVVNRNSLEQDQERLRQSLDNLLYQVQQLGDVGQRMQDLYERSLLESSLLASRQHQRPSDRPPVSGIRTEGGASTQTVNANVEYDPLEMDRFTGFHSLSQEMIELIVRVRESASDIEFVVDETDQVTRMFRQVTTQLQEGLTRSRMVPFAQTADRLPRAVRDISMKVGKQAELQIEGRETLIDKMILEQLYDPMTHLVNNALTHGIESPEVRRASGKPPAGRITIRAFHQGNQTIISVSDDGAGIDVERVRTKAVEKGLLSPEDARSMTRLDVYDLLFHPGFTTKDQADDFSGRGVGMDVVRTSLSEIRGVINTDSVPGRGTTFTIRLPLTLSISKALCCVSDRARIAFPMDGVEDMLDVPRERIQTNAEGQPCISWRDTLLPLRPLTELLAYNRHISRGNVYGGNQEDDIISVVVLRSAGNFLALQVDQVIGEQEIVIKQLEGPVPKPVGVAGATVLGDGRIMPIADVLELIDLSVGRIRRDVGGSLWEQDGAQAVQEPPATKTEPTVLIVDDSITVRELLSMTFNKVGYRVEQARDGQEAWEKLRSGLPCDIVFCDIEMPRMDGLELLSRIQRDQNLNQLPIAMLTSRGADRHRQMASSLGASGYFTKPYLEEALLDAAQRMLKGERLL